MDKFVETFIGDEERVNYGIFKKTKNNCVINNGNKDRATKNYIFSNGNKKKDFNDLYSNFISDMILKNITDNYDGDKNKEEEIEQKIFNTYKEKIEKLKIEDNGDKKKDKNNESQNNGENKEKKKDKNNGSQNNGENKTKKKVKFQDELVEVIDVENYKKYNAENYFEVSEEQTKNAEENVEDSKEQTEEDKEPKEQMNIQVDEEEEQSDGNSENTSIELLKKQYGYEDFKQNLEKYSTNEKEKKYFEQNLTSLYDRFIDMFAKEQNKITDLNKIINIGDTKKNVFDKLVKNIRDELEIELLRDKLEYPEKNENDEHEKLKRAKPVNKTSNEEKFFYNQSWSERSAGSQIGFILSIIPGLGLPFLFNLIYHKCIKNGCACCSKESVNVLGGEPTRALNS